MRPLRLGTRGSLLARRQSELVAERLRSLGLDVEVETITTSGDLRPVDSSPGEGVFVTAIAEALARGEIDLAVHSAKDVPLEEHPELVIAAFPLRADPLDVLVTKDGGASVATLAAGSRVGTDSPRRRGFLLAERPDLRVIPLHGNVDTRLRRLDAGEAEALLLAAAGLERLERSKRADERLPVDRFPPAPGQGALAVQARRQDRELIDALERLDDPRVRAAVTAERAVLTATGGGCRAPVGALATASGRRIELVAGAVEPDGSRRHLVRLTGEDPGELGAEAGRALREVITV
jgi:hydroxymethylbilane synthase